MSFRFLLVSLSEATLAPWKDALGNIEGVDFAYGYGAEYAKQCDAAIVAFYHAHDRYGGSPEEGKAQILENSQEDGYPRWIIATPPFRPSTDPLDETTLEERQFYQIKACMNEAIHFNTKTGIDVIKSILIHLEGLGLKPTAATLKGVQRALCS